MVSVMRILVRPQKDSENDRAIFGLRPARQLPSF